MLSIQRSEIPAATATFAFTFILGFVLLASVADLCNSADYSWVAHMPAVVQ